MALEQMQFGQSAKTRFCSDIAHDAPPPHASRWCGSYCARGARHARIWRWHCDPRYRWQPRWSPASLFHATGSGLLGTPGIARTR